jgi:hypothetical protein
MGGIYYKIAGMPSRGRERLPFQATWNTFLLIKISEKKIAQEKLFYQEV